MGIFGGGGANNDDFLALKTRVSQLEKQVATLVAVLNGRFGPA